MGTLPEIEKHLIVIVARSLMIEEKDVQLKSSLMLDLDAESIDILDIKFAVEQQFGFKFHNDEIRNWLKNAALDRNLTEKDIPRLFTVGSLVEYVAHKIDQKNAPK